MQNIKSLLENDNFLNNQNYAKSRLENRLSPFNIILSNKIVNLINKKFCIYADNDNKENLFIVLIFLIVLWLLAYVSIFFLINVFLTIIFFYVLVYILLGISWYNLKKMKIFVDYKQWKKYFICSVIKSENLIEDMFFKK